MALPFGYRSSHAINRFIREYNADPQLFIWKAAPAYILKSDDCLRGIILDHQIHATHTSGLPHPLNPPAHNGVAQLERSCAETEWCRQFQTREGRGFPCQELRWATPTKGRSHGGAQISMIKELHFDVAEFDARLAAVKNEMSKRGIDILLLSEPPNQNYLTGYNAYSYYTPQMVVVAVDRKEPIWIGRLIDHVSATMTTYLTEESIRGYPDTYVQSTILSAYDFMAGIVKEVGGEKARIGVEMGGYYYSARAHADLTRALPFAEFVDADLLVGWIRLVKSHSEISIMRQAGQLADAAMQRVIDTVEAGVRECDIAAAIYHQQVSGTPDFGGDYPCCPPDLCIGDRSIAPHAAWTDEPVQDSTIVNLELSGCRHRYQVNLARTIAVGKPSTAFHDLSEIAVEALNIGLESIRPGRRCSEVYSAFSLALARHRIEKNSRIGYPTGIGFPPASGERTASIRKGDETVLQPGMVFHLMPGLWLDDVGITITQSFAVTDRGFEALTMTPRRLFVK